MAGTICGVAVRIAADFPKAEYTRCASHHLNLAIVAACSLQPIRDVMGTVKETCLFFNNSPKRQKVLEDCISETVSGSKVKKLVSLCRTQWIARINAFEVFCDLLKAIVAALAAIRSNAGHKWDAENITMAGGLYLNITRFEFLMGFLVCLKGLRYVKSLTIGLQSSHVDICKAYRHIKYIKTAIQETRREAEQTHEASLLWNYQRS